MSKLRAFLESLEQNTNYFDTFCDCDRGEQSHLLSCWTLAWRKDYEAAIEELNLSGEQK